MDYYTLLFVQGAVLLISAISVLIAWRLDVTLKGVDEYAVGTSLLAIAMILSIALERFQHFGQVISNLFLYLGFTLLRFGFRRLLGAPVQHASYWRAGALIAVITAVSIWASAGDLVTSRYWRMVIFSFYMTIIAVMIASDQWRFGSDLARGPRGYVGIAFLIIAGTNTARGVWAIIDPITQVEAYPSAYELVYRLLMIMASIAIIVGVVLMMSSRLLVRLNSQATSDPLTGVLNRRGFHDVMNTMLALSVRKGSSAILFCMDLDRFKSINDQHGHAVGDIVLREFVTVASATLRAKDVLSRFGGEEFVGLVLDGGVERAKEVAERLRKAWEEHETHHASGVARTTVSIGVAAIDPRAAHPIEDAYRRADAALYRAKERGRNRVEVDATPIDFLATGQWHKITG